MGKKVKELHGLAIIWFITLLLEWKLDIKRLLTGDFLGQEICMTVVPF